MLNSIITGSGSFIPERIIKNNHFLDYDFFGEDGERITKSNTETIQKFVEITEIEERRYADANLLNTDIAAIAGEKALADANVNKNDLDYVFVAHNYGDVDAEFRQADVMPQLAARVKNKLGISNNKCKPYDMLFGCPGWIEALIVAHQFLQAGIGKKFLIIGSDLLSRVVDPHDRTAMIFADGAAAVVLEAKESNEKEGILGHETIADNAEELFYLKSGQSLNKNYVGSNVNINMKGRKVYEYALRKVPALVKRVIDNTGLDITDIQKVLLHQANAKMDHAMVQRLFKLYGIKEYDKDIAPMTVQKLGNTSVATVPTMYDLVAKKQLGNHTFNAGDHIVFASVGAGMAINAVVYKHPKG